MHIFTRWQNFESCRRRPVSVTYNDYVCMDLNLMVDTRASGINSIVLLYPTSTLWLGNQQRLAAIIHLAYEAKFYSKNIEKYH